MPNNWVSYGSFNAVSAGQRNLTVGQSDNTKKINNDWSGPDMKMSKVGNQTNSQDPQAVNSRVFVGNLNTYYCTKTDVERMFQRYGRLAGISMHKGYAFVQYTNPFDARGACLGEDGRTILGQTLDVNMVSEPKPHQTGRKRQNVAKTGNDWDYYYDSYYRSRNNFAGMNRGGVPPLKRPRLLQSARPGQAVVQTAPQPVHFTKPKTAAAPSLDQIKTYSNPDILICGNCREMFSELHELLEHKKEFCKLRFTCKCNLMNGHSKDSNGDLELLSNQQVDQCYIADLEETSTMLLCVQCKEGFHNAWDLMVHVQDAHMVNIYEMGPRRDQNKNNDHDDEDSNHQDQDAEAQLKVNLMEATADSPEAQQNGISQHMDMGGRTNGLEEITAD